MRLMGEQFVTGETIAEALANARPREAQGFRYSYDMLGEAALTADDAARYRRAYEDAIDAIGRASAGRGIHAGPGISIKLSALHPRYSRAQIDRVGSELYPVLKDLALRSRRHDIGLNIDAEEADRLEISLDLLERLCFEPELAGWNGIGFVVQAYQKRCPFVIDALVDLARRSGHRLMVRLVKGAYWDSEIKRAQVDGLDGYPVYTRKAYTDVAYLACARRLLAAPDAVFAQFATHNAHTLAAIYQLAGGAAAPADRYEFQCLHGMGEPLYEQVVGRVADGKLGRPCRIYAPVGTHETLLAYLVRRLLENGANTSFVNRIADASVPIDELVEDPVTTVERIAAAEAGAGPRVDRPAASGDPAAARDLRRRAAQFARPRPVERRRAGAAGRGVASEPRRSVDGGADAGGERRGVDGSWRSPRPCHRRRPGQRHAAARSQSCRPRRHRRPRPRGDARRRRARRRERTRRRGSVGDDAGGRPRRDARARRRFARGRPAAPARPARARGGQDLSERHRRSARGGRLPALLRGPGAARSRRRRRSFRSARSSASARGISRSPSSPARSPPRSPPATRCSPSRPSRRR